MAGKSSSESEPGDLDVVVEAVGGRGAEGEPHARKEPHDRPGHDMGGRVPQDVERLAVLGSEDRKLDRPARAIFEGAIEIDHAIARLGGDGRVREAPTDAEGHIARAHTFWVVLHGTIRQLDLDHRRNLLRSCGYIVQSGTGNRVFVRTAYPNSTHAANADTRTARMGSAVAARPLTRGHKPLPGESRCQLRKECANSSAATLVAQHDNRQMRHDRPR